MSTALARFAASVFLPVLAVLSSAWAEPPGSSLAQALSRARAEGCGAHAQGVSAPLNEVPALSDAARRIAGGAPLQQAMRAAGYRAERAMEIQLSGYPSTAAIAQAVRQRYCQALGNPAFTEVGIHREGHAAWIILADPFSPPAQGQAPQVAQQVLALVNQARGQGRTCGGKSFGPAPSLSLNAALTRAAQAHAKDMAAHDFMGHQGSQGSTPSQRVSQAGYHWHAVGENVAGGPQTAQAVVQGWLHSPEHCANIMDPAFRDMGVAYAVNKHSRYGIYWAQEFGARR